MIDGKIFREGPVNESDSGNRLDKWLAGILDELSRARIQSLIQEGYLRVNDLTIKEASAKIKQGDMVELRIPAPIPAKPAAERIPLDVIFEDDSVIVINKPAGLVVHPAAGNPNGTLVNALIAHCGGSLSGIGGVKRPGIVHRLDKDTSGLIIAAKNDASHQYLVESFKNNIIHRIYQAMVWGVPSPRKGEVIGNIGRSSRNRKKMAVLVDAGRTARTHYKVLHALSGKCALLECRLDTGRTHQIRVHLAHIGHPVIGDQIYGSAAKGYVLQLPPAAQLAVGALKRQFLHAVSLSFRHPINGHDLQFTAPLPVELAEIFTKCSKRV